MPYRFWQGLEGPISRILQEALWLSKCYQQGRPGLESQLCHFAACPGANHLTSVSASFLICKQFLLQKILRALNRNNVSCAAHGVWYAEWVSNG